MDDGIDTWHVFKDLLTPEQIAALERSDANPTHPLGPEGHRVGMLMNARMMSAQGPGGLN
ncbi:hypothetical protein [Mycolicibacterium sp. CR10]|uniref:hypothetical protein n=1 Tax=Mycolicibacterium sp. CR10 TaxID=2562314 RepID=UPI0010BF8225|nr:hypothetical protein [Mycolicibacterium sp. CR10]